jgi:glucose-1-phosphate cytidylyltransferase
MKAVLLAGGLGTRLREETEFRPKPMVEIGGKPILWHIMKNLSMQQISEFVICLGYKGDFIRDYFLNYQIRNNDFTISLRDQHVSKFEKEKHLEDWQVTLSETGLSTQTGGRLYKVRDYLDEDNFLCTYGDGLADINIEGLVDFHSSHKRIATVTAVRAASRFGALSISNDSGVSEFSEKPKSEQWINGGFFIFSRKVFEYLNHDSILEKDPLENLAKDGQLMAYRHEGFWQPMDTYRETQELNAMWQQECAPWKNW